MKKHFLIKKVTVTFLSLLVIVTLCFQDAAGAIEIKEGKVSLLLTLKLPAGYEFIAGAPFAIECQTTSPKIVALPKNLPPNFNPTAGPYKIPLRAAAGTAILTLKAKVYYCNKTSKMCFQDVPETQIPLVVSGQGPSAIRYIWEITPKK